MANETEYEDGLEGSVPSKLMPDPSDPMGKLGTPDDIGPQPNPGTPGSDRPEEWRDPNETVIPDDDDEPLLSNN